MIQRKYIILIAVFLTVLLFNAGCSSSFETANLPPQERLDYAMKLYNEEDYLDAVNEFQAIILQYAGNAVSDDAQFYLAMSRYKRTEYIMAAFEFSRLIKNLPASEFVPEAQYMLAECYYQLSPNFTLDQQYTRKAIEEFQVYIDFFPTSEKVPEAERKIKELNLKLAHKAYNAANIYEKMEYYTAALLYYNNVVETYHDSPYAPIALYNRIQILLDRGRNSEALADITKFIKRYPDNRRISELEEIQASLKNKLSAAK